MRFSWVIGLLMPAVAMADGTDQHCEDLYKKMKANTTGDLSLCVPTVEEAKPLKTCTKPHSYDGKRTTSELVMIFDASGSMAGKVGGQAKMAIAKSAATTFLSEVARDVPVGLLVYGHQGNNQDSGKAESCAGVEWLRPISNKSSGLDTVINTLEPTGWTAIAAALTAAQTEFETRKKTKNETGLAKPVVYVVTDGEETCGGDPVAAAQSLTNSGVSASINVIGFDVDEETRHQLEKISDAGNGQFFPAKDAAELKKHLGGAKDAIGSQLRYNNCIAANMSIARRPYHKAAERSQRCNKTQNNRGIYLQITKQIKELSSARDLSCSKQIKRLAENQKTVDTKIYLKDYSDLLDQGAVAAEKARVWSIENALPPK